jgi:amino acid permease
MIGDDESGENEGQPDGSNARREGSPASSYSDDDQVRKGTIASARFNMLSTMVGGGSLSLPLAFYKSGNGLVGPLMLIVVALLTEFCFRVHVGSARLLASEGSSSSLWPRGKDSFESVTSRALGRHMNVMSMALVTAMCFFGTVGYAVLLRDMLQPVTDAVWHPTAGGSGGGGNSGPSLHNNLTMLTVVLVMTPFCALNTLTALQRFGAASMLAVLVLGGCVVYRSAQCQYDLWVHPPVIHGGSPTPYGFWDAFEVREGMRRLSIDSPAP